jgi:hypothetical protein
MDMNETIGKIGRQLPIAKRLDSALDRGIIGRDVPRSIRLPGGVKVAQVTLTHLVLVRIQAGQPFAGSSSTRNDTKPTDRWIGESISAFRVLDSRFGYAYRLDFISV